MHSDGKIKQIFEISGSPHGRGHLYITDSGIFFESIIHGRVFYLNFEVITRYCIKGRQFRIDWVENNTKLYYVMTASSPKQILDAYRNANMEYATSAQNQG